MLNINPEDLKIHQLEKSETIPSEWYFGEEFYNFEKKNIFEKEWQYAGHISQLSKPGDYFLIEIAGNPLIVIKDDNEKIKGFYNVCRHRGGPLAFEEGNCRMLQCKYHGWTYKLDGSLRGVPRFDRVDLFDKKDYGLHPVELDFWEGLIFVRLSKGDKSLNSLLKEFLKTSYQTKLILKNTSRVLNTKLNATGKLTQIIFLKGTICLMCILNYVIYLMLKNILLKLFNITHFSEAGLKDLGNFIKMMGMFFIILFIRILCSIFCQGDFRQILSFL